MRPRSVPLMREMLVPAKGLVESSWLEWIRPVEEYFDQAIQLTTVPPTCWGTEGVSGLPPTISLYGEGST